MKTVNPKSYKIAVFGASLCNEEVYELAKNVGREIAYNKALLVCGGLGGVMEAASRGAHETGGITIGILPDDNENSANPYTDIVIVTNLGHARNIVLAHTCHGAIAVTGSLGTLSEIAITLKLGKPVVGLNSWEVDPRIIKAVTPKDAVQKLIQAMDMKS